MAASMEKDVAVKMSFTFGSTVIDDREILDFQVPGTSVDLLPASDQSADPGDALDFEAADLHDAGELRLTVYHWQDIDIQAEIGEKAALAITMPSGTVVTYALTAATGSVNAKGGAILQSYTPQNAPLNGRMMADVVFKICTAAAVVPVP